MGGITRPAMLFDMVPLLPALVMAGAVSMIAVLTHPLVYIAILPLFFVMSGITRKDDNAFRSIWLWCKYRLVDFDWNKKFWLSTSYSPLQTRRRK